MSEPWRPPPPEKWWRPLQEVSWNVWSRSPARNDYERGRMAQRRARRLARRRAELSIPPSVVAPPPRRKPKRQRRPTWVMSWRCHDGRMIMVRAGRVVEPRQPVTTVDELVTAR